MKLEHASGMQTKQIEQLYVKAFPEPERKPFSMILEKTEEGVCDLLAISGENGEFFGLVISLLYSDMVLIDYFAVSEASRGKGIGSQVISLIKEKYHGRRVFLEIELPDPEAPNQEQRVMRKKFYLRNGFTDDQIHVDVYGTDMELLSLCGTVSFEEYCTLLRNVLGDKVMELLSPRLLP